MNEPTVDGSAGMATCSFREWLSAVAAPHVVTRTWMEGGVRISQRVECPPRADALARLLRELESDLEDEGNGNDDGRRQ